jgi:hypothetical protein
VGRRRRLLLLAPGSSTPSLPRPRPPPPPPPYLPSSTPGGKRRGLRTHPACPPCVEHPISIHARPHPAPPRPGAPCPLPMRRSAP